MRFTPHAYQQRAVEFILDHPKCALFLDMGLGKTVVTLTAVQQLIEDYLEVRKVLVIAPKSVARNTWPSECRKWDHLKGLRVSVIMGTAAQRRKAVEADADVYVVNRETSSGWWTTATWSWCGGTTTVWSSTSRPASRTRSPRGTAPFAG